MNWLQLLLHMLLVFLLQSHLGLQLTFVMLLLLRLNLVKLA